MPSLWRQPAFLKLWIGHTVSCVGTQISAIALPLTATLLLDASPRQMGVLTALETLPFPLFCLFAGVWVDRVRRLPVLIMTDLARAVLLCLVPFAAWLGRLQIAQLYVLGFLVGSMSVFFDIAHQSFVPAISNREQLVDANAKLEFSRALSSLIGPGLGGVLIRLLSPPIAVAVDAASFLFSGIMHMSIGQREPAPGAPEARQGVWASMLEGLRVVMNNPTLRAAAACSATGNLFSSMSAALFVLYTTRELNLSPGWLGLVFAGSSGGALLATVVVRPVTARHGIGWIIVFTHLVMGASALLVSLVHGAGPGSIALLVLAQFAAALGSVAFNINSRSLRQAVAPPALLGRVNASVRFVVWGTMPLGGLIGGLLGERLGMRPTLAVGGVGLLLAPLWVVFSPVLKRGGQP